MDGMFTHESEGARGLQLQLYSWNWRTYEGHKRSHILQKW